MRKLLKVPFFLLLSALLLNYPLICFSATNSTLKKANTMRSPTLFSRANPATQAALGADVAATEKYAETMEKPLDKAYQLSMPLLVVSMRGDHESYARILEKMQTALKAAAETPAKERK